jgi:hypothetical protein
MKAEMLQLLAEIARRETEFKPAGEALDDLVSVSARGLPEAQDLSD